MLSVEQKQQLVRDGFLPLPQIVPRDLVNKAVRAINHSLGENGLPPDDLPVLRARSYCREIQHQNVISDLFNETPLWSIADELFGEGNIGRQSGGQIALRFPRADDNFREPGPHIDGIPTSTNGVPPGTLANFTALVGILLSDLPDENAGNFTVWPGTHLQYAQYFKEHNPRELIGGMPRVEVPPANQITGRAGDAVFCHYMLGHGIAPNVSPHIRYAVFFRLHHREHDEHKWEVMTDLWHDWPGLHDVL
jgi:hypothetical protein